MFLYRLGTTAALAAARTAAPFIPKLKRGFEARRGLNSRAASWRASVDRAPLWFHVASSGEFEQVVPVLERIRELDPALPIALTFFSPSGERAISLETKRRGESKLPWDFADFSPIDRPAEVSAFLKALEPSQLVLVHREIWPELVLGCAGREIPVHLISGYFPSYLGSRLRLYESSLRRMKTISTIDRGSSIRLQTLVEGSAIPVQALGDPRIERVLARASRSEKLTPPCKVWIAASLWPEDFKALKPVILRLLREPTWKLVIVPHELSPRTLARYERFFSKFGCHSARWSATQDPWENNKPLIVDRVGLLAELYSAASIVFVGGSFRKRVHNVLEPAAHGCPILCGPYIQNSVEAVEMDGMSQGVLSVKSSQELLLAAEQWIGSEATRSHFGSEAAAYLRSRTGASDRYARLLLHK